jgi:hypothetical protein
MKHNYVSVRGRSLIVVQDHEGLRSFGEMSRHDPDALRRLDVWLDSKDANNELSDGTLPV